MSIDLSASAPPIAATALSTILRARICDCSVSVPVAADTAALAPHASNTKNLRIPSSRISESGDARPRHCDGP